jgi:hypothetical protein
MKTPLLPRVKHIRAGALPHPNGSSRDIRLTPGVFDPCASIGVCLPERIDGIAIQTW